MKTHMNICLSTGQERGKVSPFNLDGVHARYKHMLTIFKGRNKTLEVLGVSEHHPRLLGNVRAEIAR